MNDEIQARLDDLRIKSENLSVAIGEISGLLKNTSNQPTAPDVISNPPLWTDGFSTYADEDGAVHIREVDKHLGLLPEAVRPKCYSRFIFEQSYRKAIFPSDDAKAKAYLNLSQRKWTVFLFGGAQESDQAITFNVVPNPAFQTDFSQPPETGIGKFFHRTGLRNDIASSNWNPERDAKWWYNWWKGKARSELEVAGYKPEQYGL